MGQKYVRMSPVEEFKFLRAKKLLEDPNYFNREPSEPSEPSLTRASGDSGDSSTSNTPKLGKHSDDVRVAEGTSTLTLVPNLEPPHERLSHHRTTVLTAREALRLEKLTTPTYTRAQLIRDAVVAWMNKMELDK